MTPTALDCKVSDTQSSDDDDDKSPILRTKQHLQVIIMSDYYKVINLSDIR